MIEVPTTGKVWDPLTGELNDVEMIEVEMPSKPMDRVAFIAYHMRERLMTEEEASAYYHYPY